MFGFQPPRIALPPPPPTPGQVVSTIGAGLQAVEQFVNAGVNAAVDTIQQVATTAVNTPGVTVGGSNGNRAELVDARTFRAFADTVAQGFQQIRAELASIRAYGSGGDEGGGGILGGLGGGGGFNDLLMLSLLGVIDLGTSSGTGTLDTTTLLLLMMSQGGGGFGGGFGGGSNDALMLLLLTGAL